MVMSDTLDDLIIAKTLATIRRRELEAILSERLLKTNNSEERNEKPNPNNSSKIPLH